MKKIAYICVLVIVVSIAARPAAAQDITIFPDSPSVGNCFPFGNGGVLGGDAWGPFMGFIYQNIPPFALAPGDIIAFDLGEINGSDVQLDIELAATAFNGSTDPGGPFVKIVSNTQTPLNPNGDTIVGDFEMQFTVEAPFVFPGGGLIIRFSNPSVSYALYDQCDQVLVKGDSSDTSGFFISRFFQDPDGLPPYQDTDGGSIGAFRIVATGGFSNIPTLSEWGMISAAAGLGLIGVLFAVRRRKRSMMQDAG
jgi:hypothetical protein